MEAIVSILGTRVVRTEDPRLLTDGGTYVGDVRTPELAGPACATFARSPFAHALIKGVDATEALAAPGVVAVLTFADINDIPPPPPRPESGPPPGSEAAPRPLGGVWQEPLLAVDRVRFVGEPVAIVLNEESYPGEDAAELVVVDYEPLPAVVGIAESLAGGTLLFPDAGSNIPVDHVRGDPGASRSWADVARRAGAEGLSAFVHYQEGTPTFPFGSHVAVVEPGGASCPPVR
jgi:aerobic carbon-monoxide dehydrogenase large subunit